MRKKELKKVSQNARPLNQRFSIVRFVRNYLRKEMEENTFSNPVEIWYFQKYFSEINRKKKIKKRLLLKKNNACKIDVK